MKIFICFSLVFIMACSSAKYLTKVDDRYELTTPNVNWIISFPGSGLSLEIKKSNPEGTAVYHMFTNKKTGLNVSFVIEPAIDFEDPVSYRDQYSGNLKQMYDHVENVTKKEFPDYALLEYLIPEVMGIKIYHQHMNAMYVKDDFWVDLHLSKVEFKEDDRKRFYNFINSVDFRLKSNFAKYSSPQDSLIKTTMQYFQYGNRVYLLGKYKTAIRWYQKALDQESRQLTLKSDYWCVLVDNLGMCYAVSGNLVKAREIFEYGLSQNNTYPMFYYNLACTYAEMGSLDKCLENLKTAYKYKKNMLQGEEFPDLRSDSSFQKYLNNKEFLKLVDDKITR